MDSTLIATEVIDELGDLAGVGAQVKKITARAMAGELDFADSLRRRVSLLQGLSESSLDKVASMMPLTEGVEQLFKILNHLGYKTAIISGGFTFFGDKLKSRLGIDHVYANELEIKENCLTGQVLGPIIGAQQKSDILQQIAARENISLEQTIAVGDGANDLPMLSAAGLGIAFNAKPMVRKAANQSISTLGLDSLLYLMGIRDHELNTFLS
jgi:phosphoserine phosphatase